MAQADAIDGRRDHNHAFTSYETKPKVPTLEERSRRSGQARGPMNQGSNVEHQSLTEAQKPSSICSCVRAQREQGYCPRIAKLLTTLL